LAVGLKKNSEKFRIYRALKSYKKKLGEVIFSSYFGKLVCELTIEG